MRHAFTIQGDVGFANAIRRTLIEDLENWAPCKVTFRSNTSCQTDEYIAHRIGLIPFRKAGEGNEMTLRHKGGIVYAHHVTGCAFEPIHCDVPIMDLGDDSVLDITIFFDKRKPSKHARYSTCTAVGMEKLEDQRYRITFEMHDDQLNASKVFALALDNLEARVDDCLQKLGNQPDPPPKSRCG